MPNPSLLPDSIVFHSLHEIKDSISCVVANTSPIDDLQGYYSHTDGKIAIIALLVAIIAAVFSVLCFLYQRRSAIMLERANHRRPSLYPLVTKLYDNSICLQILLEYDSEYNMSYTAESKLPEEKRSSYEKQLFYDRYDFESLISEMYLPEDVILLEKYEIYMNNDIYNLAYTVRNDIYSYNKKIKDLLQHMETKSKDKKILSDKDSIYTISRRLIKELLFLDELVTKSETLWYQKKDAKYLEKEVSYYIISRLLSSIKNISKDIVLSDPYLITDANIIEIDCDITLKDFLKRKNILDNSFKTSKLVFLEYIRQWKWIKKNKWIEKKYILERKVSGKLKDPERIQLKTNFYSSEVLIKQMQSDVNNTSPIQNTLKDCLGDIYETIKAQLLRGKFDMDIIIKYDVISQIALNKHNYLLRMGKGDYVNEARRLEKKAIWFQQKNKVAEE
ncbi:MAG: hypothetical protein ACI3ZQ_03620 [Candidatus Cryptobacteroides sp.]